MKKKKEEITIRSSAAEYLTYVASVGEQQDIVEMRRSLIHSCDMVSHVKFGEVKVLAIEDSARDYMVTVEFAEYGQKKMLAGFARLKKL